MAPKVLRFFVSRTQHAQIALDLTGESLAKAFECRSQFRGSGDEEAAAWLWAVARRELAMYVRHEKVELAATLRLGIDRPVADDDELARIEDLAVVEQDRTALNSAFADLSDDHRAVLQMHVVDELGYEEISARLGVSNDVVRARVSRGMRLLAGRAHAAGLRPGSR